MENILPQIIFSSLPNQVEHSGSPCLTQKDYKFWTGFCNFFLSQLPSMYSAQGIFQHHFQCKKVGIILNKIWLTISMTSFFCNGTASFKNVSNCLNTNIYSYLEASGGQSYNLYENVVHFFQHQC
jgi:hypothetical protein